MALTDYVLYRIAKRWPSPVKYRAEKYGAEPETDAYEMAYTYDQFNRKVRDGLRISCTDKDVLEIGCGHGGISSYLAVAGSRSVVGIDLNTKNLEFARRFAAIVESRFGPGAKLPLTFEVMNAYAMTFPENSFDIVVAENAFEHFMEPEVVMQQSYKVLRPGGGLLVPIFSSIYSKYGLHLKHGLKMPWANLFFSERTILNAMRRLADEQPKLHEIYPGLANNPQHVRDVRAYKDLNDITFKKFKQMAKRTGFTVDWFYPNYTRFGTIVRVTPVLRHSILMDIFSMGAAAYLRKPG